MKANGAPEKIFVNPNALQNSGYNGKNYMFIHDSVFDESKCTIEYTRTDVFIEKAAQWLKENLLNHTYVYEGEVGIGMAVFLEDFRKYMEGE